MATNKRGLSVEKREGRVKVRPVRVELHCDVNGCAGLMRSTGVGFTQIDTTWNHRCSMCGIEEGVVNATYPYIEYVEI